MKISDLDVSKSAELKESRSKAEKFLKEAERNARKEAMAKKKREKESKELTDLIRSRGIQIVTHKVPLYSCQWSISSTLPVKK